MKSALAVAVAALLAAGPLLAQLPPPGGGAPIPRPGSMDDPARAPGGANDPLRRSADDPVKSPSDAGDPLRRGGRISETAPLPRESAPAPRAGASGEARYRDDLRRCDTLDPAARTSCRLEMSAARAQGLYRD